MLPDVVIPVRPGDDNEELRYTLRGIAAHVPHRYVWLVGHLPTWTSEQVGYIRTEQWRGKWGNTRANILAACHDPDVTDEFLLFNDDMFVMRPLERMPVLHRGPVAEVLQQYAEVGIRSSRYLLGMRATAEWLREQHGIAEPLSYELHVPMLVEKRARAEVTLLSETIGVQVPHVRTIYGNLLRLGGERMADVKIHTLDEVPPDDAVFVSTEDSAFNLGAVGRWVRPRLPEPCVYEAEEWHGCTAS